jgi:protein O-GlcNAc transferase
MPSLAQALTIALAHHQAGQLDLAEEIYQRILATEPEHAKALHLWGVIAHQRGQQAVAAQRIRRAIALQPGVPGFHANLGEVCRVRGELREAVACYQRALELDPQLAVAHNGLGLALENLGQVSAAIACYRRALECEPRLAEAHYNLGLTWHKLGNLDAAVDCQRRALELNPNFADAWNNLGTTLADQGHFAAAIPCYQRTLELHADDVEARVNLGTAMLGQGNPDEAIAWYRQALELAPDSATAHSNLLFALQYRPGVTLAELAAAHAAYDRRHSPGLRPAQPHARRPADADRALRLGFVSPDFARHPVGFFLIRVLENLDRKTCETVCYADRLAHDELSERFQRAAGQWRPVYHLSDEQLAAQIRADRIDLLFDLAGHTAHNRLLVFARKPAPVQITWLGYEGTTGLESMDYLLANRHLVPPAAEPYYRERILRLPESYLCYDPPPAAPPVAPLPALAAGVVTFGSYNNPAKLTPVVLNTWAAILRRMPAARLVLKYRACEDAVVQARLQQVFQDAGVTAERVRISGPVSYEEYLASYREIDIALDPFPFSGGVTTCDALWMGVPVITCPGATFASRHGLSHLSAIGLTETIADSLDEYVERAVRLATDLPRLAELRAGLRTRMARSSLCDGPRFAENLLTLLREVWRRWCGTEEENAQS